MRDMRFIISPAKKMNVDRDTMEVGGETGFVGEGGGAFGVDEGDG